MENHESLFQKIEERGREWDAQVQILKDKAKILDVEARIKFEDQIDTLNLKLKAIEKRTSELKKISKEVSKEAADKIVHSWIESLTKIDNAILKLKK